MLVYLVVVPLWTLLLMRLMAVRSVVSPRSLAGFLLGGGLVGVLSIPFAERLAVPYSEFSQFGMYVQELSAIMRQLILFLPVVAVLAGRKFYKTISIADAFLIGFVFGFGFDLVTYALAASNASEQLKELTWLPPGGVSTAKATFAGRVIGSA